MGFGNYVNADSLSVFLLNSSCELKFDGCAWLGHDMEMHGSQWTSYCLPMLGVSKAAKTTTPK